MSYGYETFSLARMRPLHALGLAAVVALLTAAHVPTGGIVSGAVTDAATGEPLPGANVQIVGTALGAATDVDGRFELLDVPPGRQDLRVSFVGYASETVSVDVSEGERTLVDVALAAAAAVDEVVVTGARPVRSRAAVGAARVLSGEAAADASPRPAGFAEAPAPPAPATPRERTGDGDDRDAPQRQPGLLTAGDIDDGLNWDAYLGYARRARSGQDSEPMPDLGLSDRIVLRVVDSAGHPVAGARVTVEARGGRRARRLVTEAGTDGRLALFPRYDFGRGVREMRVTVAEPGGGRQARTRTLAVGRNADAAVEIALPLRIADRVRALDLAFVIDVTGSMSDELRYLTDEFADIVERVEGRYPGVDLRFGLVAYRDEGDQFVTRRFDFTRSADEMQRRLAGLRADGGGDYPEAMDQALESALDLDWRTGTAGRIAFLVADAPPHADKTEKTLAAVREARARGLRLYPVAASGVADEAEYVMRAAAVLTQGRHLFLTDDSGVGLPHAEPKIACYQVTPLNSLIVRVVASELEGRRVEADRADVIREVGDYDAGVCEPTVVVQRPVEPRRQGELGYVED